MKCCACGFYFDALDKCPGCDVEICDECYNEDGTCYICVI